MEIKQLREALGWSREKMASELEVSLYSLQKWELGLNKPSRLSRKAIAELMEREGIPKEGKEEPK